MEREPVGVPVPVREGRREKELVCETVPEGVEVELCEGEALGVADKVGVEDVVGVADVVGVGELENRVTCQSMEVACQALPVRGTTSTL